MGDEVLIFEEVVELTAELPTDFTDSCLVTEYAASCIQADDNTFTAHIL